MWKPENWNRHFSKNETRAKGSLCATAQTNQQAAYFAHYENIRAHITVEDFSRVDAMIALRMRANGHSPEAVLAAIRDCAPQIRTGAERRRNWQSYAQRTADYAFGFAGDRDLQRNEKFFNLWTQVENINYYKSKEINNIILRYK